MVVACGFDHAGFALREQVLAVVAGRADRGILVCGPGAGVSVVASKIRGFRPTAIHDTYTGHQAVEHDGVNLLCMGTRVIGPELAAEIVDAFLRAEVSDEERHVSRRTKIDQIERTGGVGQREGSAAR